MPSMQQWLGAAAVSAMLAGTAQAGEVSRGAFGRMPDGTPIETLVLSNESGIRATIITYGAALQALTLPEPDGRRVDIALGHRTLAEYTDKRQFMGATVGRVANRIGGARFTLDGQTYQVTANDGPHALHGGTRGFDTAVWQVKGVRSGAGFAEVTLQHVSSEGDQGFPGKVTATVRYRLGSDDTLGIEYTATTDRSTVVSLSNHAYWNVAGEGADRGAMGLQLTIPAEHYLPVDSGLIPTGERRPVAGTVFDFRTPRAIGDRVRDAADEQIRVGRGYDHNWVVTPAVTREPHLMARVGDPVSGRAMELWSDQPGLQFYSGNFLDATTVGKSGKLYRMGDAIVLEPQAFPDTVNRPDFGSVRLDPGQTYRNRMSYRFFPAPASR